MSLFKMVESLTKAAVSVATMPVDAVADVVTMGGVLSDRRTTYTGDKVRRVMQHLDDATEGK